MNLGFVYKYAFIKYINMHAAVLYATYAPSHTDLHMSVVCRNSRLFTFTNTTTMQNSWGAFHSFSHLAKKSTHAILKTNAKGMFWVQIFCNTFQQGRKIPFVCWRQTKFEMFKAVGLLMNKYCLNKTIIKRLKWL